MPRVFRTMLPDEQGRPKIGCESGPGLGARVPPDVTPDSIGNVFPGIGGMSVAPSIGALKPHLIPKRLRGRFPDATGSNGRVIWSMGDGLFADAPIAANLKLRVTSKLHGHVEPDAPMHIDKFQNALAATQNDWRKNED